MIAEVRWLTAREAAAYARCHPDTIRAAAQTRRLSGVKSGSSRQAQWRFTTTDIDNWLEAGRVTAGPVRARKAS